MRSAARRHLRTYTGRYRDRLRPSHHARRRSVVRPGHRRRYAQWPQLLIYDPCRQPPGSPGPRGTVEHPGQGRITVRAPAVAGQTPGAQPVPVALDQQRAALVAAGALALRIVHVAGAGVAQAVIQAMRRARASVAAGVGGRSRILKSGWNAVKCTGTSGPSCPATHRVRASISASESLRPGISKLVIQPHAGLVPEVQQGPPAPDPAWPGRSGGRNRRWIPSGPRSPRRYARRTPSAAARTCTPPSPPLPRCPLGGTRRPHRSRTPGR